MYFDQELDARKLQCFMLTLSTKKTLAAMDSGKILKLISISPGAVAEFKAYTKQTGDEFLASTEANGEQILFIRKK
jgi:tRNA 2-thiouridine synthesizing protein A